MTDSALNILSFGLKPLFEKQSSFHDLIVEFREKFSNPSRSSLVHADITEFYERLNDFDFNFVLFEKYFRKQIGNFNRFKSDLDENDFNLNFLRIALEENKWKPTKPFQIFIHHLKYEYKFTAKPFIFFQKKQHRKKLDVLEIVPNNITKSKQSNNWTRVPIKKPRQKN